MGQKEGVVSTHRGIGKAQLKHQSEKNRLGYTSISFGAQHTQKAEPCGITAIPKIKIYPASLSHPCQQLSYHLTEGTHLPLSKTEGPVLWEHIYL